MKKIWLCIILLANLYATNTQKQNIGIFDGKDIFDVDLIQIFTTLSSEVGNDKFQQEYNKIIQEPNFQNVLKNINQKKPTKNPRHPNQKPITMPNFTQALKDLNTSIKIQDSFIKAYLGIELLKIRYWMRDISANRHYGLGFAKSAYKHKLCYGYYYYGLLVNEIIRDIDKSLKIWGDGIKECKDKELHKQISMKFYKYKYITSANIKLNAPEK